VFNLNLNESTRIAKLLSHHLQHPKIQEMMQKYRITERWWDNDKYDYTDHENTICLSFVNGKTFNKRYALPLIDRFGNPLTANETPKDSNHLFLTSISFRPGFKGNLPFALSLNMDDAAVSQIVQTKPIGSSIREPSLQALENGITCIKWHLYPYILLYVIHQGTKLHVFQFSLIENRQIEEYNLYSDYPDYVKKKSWYHYFKCWH